MYEIGELPATEDEGAYPYIAMQMINGLPLHRAQAGMSLFEKVQVVKQVAEALHVAHRQGLIHRDIKPSNIMIERTESGKLHPYVMDFGLARETSGSDLSRSGLIEGTPRYMSPEQARGEAKKMDRRADVYALGVTLYELLAKRAPYEAVSEIDLLMAVLTEEPKPLRSIDPDIPADLEAVTLKCLEKEAAGRYDSAKALAEDLGRYLDGDPVHARHIGVTQRLYRQARKHKALLALGTALVLSLVWLLGYGAWVRMISRERELRAKEQAKQQAELAQRLGQEITQMEWVLRSARQLPLHNLGREKAIIRRRMGQLQVELLSYGERSRGLAHYALGRGHMALHEYPQALQELEQAIAIGEQGADVHYALGFVLGKHYEQAMYEARLSGGGEWAKKQLQEIEPKFLHPAIASLQRSRALQPEAPQYLEGLIAYYQRDYNSALLHANQALGEAPWLYEATQLQGQIYLERALQARDSGQYEVAAKEFAGAVRSYEEAARIGQSDAEVYEGLAEAWVRQIEMASSRGQPTEAAYAAAVAASDKITAAEPLSIAGPLKRAHAALLTISTTDVGSTSIKRDEQCKLNAEAVLRMQPGNPYASDALAGCLAFGADAVQGRGEDPEPLLRQSLHLLENTVKQYPHFLWGVNDLGNIRITLGIYLQLHGSRDAQGMLQKSLDDFARAAALDPSYVNAPQNALSSLVWMIPEARSAQQMQDLLSATDGWIARCQAINSQYQQCFDNYFQIYVRAAQRALTAGQEVQRYLQRAEENLAKTRKLGGSLLDAEQHAALLHLLAASDRVRHKQDPGSALTALQADLPRCLAIAEQDAMCRSLDAQGEWVAADWAAERGQPVSAILKRALLKAVRATQSPEPYPDGWQTLAESHLRLGRIEQSPSARLKEISAGLSALEKVLAINPNHARGLATQGALYLLQAQQAAGSEARLTAARLAAQALQTALKLDPFLTHDYELPLSQAKALVAAAGTALQK